MPERKWQTIIIRYDDGYFTEISRDQLEKIEAITPIIDALNQAKKLKEQLEQLLR